MWKSFRSWLNNAPIGNPIERRQAPMLQIMLIGITIAASLALVNILVAAVSTERRLLGIAVNTLYIVSATSGFVALRRGNFRLAVMIPTTTSALILGMFLIAVGLRNGAPFLIVFTIPIILAGLLAGWSSTVLIIGIGVATMLMMLTLERVAPTLIGFVPVGDSTSTIVTVFILVTSVSGLFLDRFGHTLSTTLSEALARERELEQSHTALELRTSELEREIGQRTTAEAALRASEQRYRQIVETAQEGIWQIDAANRTTFVNARMAAMLGYTLDEMLGAPLFDFLDAESQAIAATNLERRRQGIAEQHEFKFRGKDGSDVWALISTNPVLDRAGAYAGALAMVTDITARKRDEEALRLSESRFATAFRASPVAMSITSLKDGRFIDINTSHERLFGYPRDELIGQSAGGINIYADPNQRAEVVRSISAYGSLRETELTLRTRLGELREVLCSLEAIEADGEACILGSVFDITARKHAEVALRENEELLRAMTNTAQVGLVIVDQDHRYRYANPAYADIFHLPSATITGQRVADVLTTVYDEQIRPRLEKAFGGERVNYELIVPPRTGEQATRHYDVTYEPGVYRGSPVVVVVVVDITERKLAELALTRSTERLRILANASRLFAEGFTGDEVLVERIARTIGESLHDYCGIRMLSDDGQWLNTVALYNASADELNALQTTMAATPIPIDAVPSLQATMQADRALLMPPLDPAQIQAALPANAQPNMQEINDYDRVIAPLRVGGQPIGVLGVTHKRSPSSPYDEDDLRLVQDLADRAALAISNARLYQELQQSYTALEARVIERTTELADANATLQRQARQASALATMSRALAEAGRDLQPLFDTIVRHLAMLLGDTCVLSMLTADRQWMQPVASHNEDTERGALIRSLLAGAPNRADAGWSAPLVATGQAVLLPHIPVAEVRKQVSPRYHPYFETVDALSLLNVPVRAHGTLLGMLTALRDRPDQPYTTDDQALLQDLADRAGLAIENARLFAEAEQARAEAEQANSAKSQFLSSMSHELRTPLNAILGFTGTLLMKLPGPLTADQEKQLTTVQRSGKHLLDLINDILDLAKIESGKVELRSERVVCQAIIDEVLTTLRPLVEQKGLRCTVVAPAEPIVIASDQRVLSQILINLVNNAIKFTDRGEVQIALAREALGGQYRVTIRVIDTGIGITAEDQAKLFQEFGRVNSDVVRAREGTGLGLRLSRKLAELLGGTIELTSELGSGSTFTLLLPEA